MTKRSIRIYVINFQLKKKKLGLNTVLIIPNKSNKKLKHSDAFIVHNNNLLSHL